MRGAVERVSRSRGGGATKDDLAHGSFGHLLKLVIQGRD
jgi:hypothetical protein